MHEREENSADSRLPVEAACGSDSAGVAVWLAWCESGWHRGALAFVDTVLLLPYLCWVSFATTLKFAVWQMDWHAWGRVGVR